MAAGREVEAFQKAEAMQEYMQKAAGHPFLSVQGSWVWCGMGSMQIRHTSMG